jgi:hypothetical protein
MSKKNQNIETVVQEDADMTQNAGTIAAKPAQVSRAQLMKQMVDYAIMLNPEELADFVARSGMPQTDHFPSSPSSRFATVNDRQTTDDNGNKKSIQSGDKAEEPMHQLPGGEPNRMNNLPAHVQEDLGVIFGDSSDLSEEFRTKVSTLFEAAVGTRVALEVAKIEEELAEEAQEALDTLKEEMEENIDNYLNYAVAEWMEQNKLAVEQNIKTEVAESFFSGLYSLFNEHHLDIPEEEVSVVESLLAKVEALESQINETTEKNIELNKVVSEKQVKEAADALSEGMTDTQKEKFTKLIEAVNYSSADEFVKKANIIKETYFASKSEVKVTQDQLLSESVEEPAAPEYVAPEMQVYVQSLSKTVKK